MRRPPPAQPASLLAVLAEVIPTARHEPRPSFHAELAAMYSWAKVARRTARVYDAASRRSRPQLADRLWRLAYLGPISATVAALLIASQQLFLVLLCYCRPANQIDATPDFPLTVSRGMRSAVDKVKGGAEPIAVARRCPLRSAMDWAWRVASLETAAGGSAP